MTNPSGPADTPIRPDSSSLFSNRVVLGVIIGVVVTALLATALVVAYWLGRGDPLKNQPAASTTAVAQSRGASASPEVKKSLTEVMMERSGVSKPIISTNEVAQWNPDSTLDSTARDTIIVNKFNPELQKMLTYIYKNRKTISSEEMDALAKILFVEGAKNNLFKATVNAFERRDAVTGGALDGEILTICDSSNYNKGRCSGVIATMIPSGTSSTGLTFDSRLYFTITSQADTGNRNVKGNTIKVEDSLSQASTILTADKTSILIQNR